MFFICVPEMVKGLQMFTGIVEEVGEISSIEVSGDGRRIEILSKLVIEDAEIGSSISINGCCLTVTNLSESTFVVEAVPETISRTCLGDMNIGDHVNMERALLANGRFGGHIVQGHVDGIAKIVAVDSQSDGSWLVGFTCSNGFAGQIVEKGSVTLNGVSLTVAGVSNLLDKEELHFDIALIPHTIEVTTFKDMGVGGLVNLEVEVLARYIESLLSSRNISISGEKV